MATEQEKLREAQFLGLISLLANSALQQLGKVISPVTGKVEINLEAAKLTIDWLAMLQEKTNGNLTDQEKQVLSSYVSNLQLNYVDVKKMEDEKKQPS
ncbi:MAG: DUF1844 domain-containing protein [Candidatus Auribacterota bacterium]|jgi:hypothetical protein|nr:DUF1844 domain-containing protein [Candidatus Auribacterota bacterium]